MLADVARPSAVNVLSVRSAFCRSCGRDHQQVTICPSCGWTTTPLPTAWSGAVGRLFTVRRGLRRRTAVQLGEEGPDAIVLVEGGSVERMSISDLPAELVPPAGLLDGARSPAGRLVFLAAAVASGARYSFDPGLLCDAAVAAARDQVAMRLLTVDAIAAGRPELVGRVPLSPSERAWALAVQVAEAGDGARLVACLRDLPADRYRRKLVLLLRVAPALIASDVDLTVVGAHLRPFADEPLAGVLHRAFRLSDGGAQGAVADARWLASATTIPPEVREMIEQAAPVVTSGDRVAVPPTVGRLGHHVRVLGARRRVGLAVQPADLARVPTPIADDLVDAGALDEALVTSASLSDEARTYLRARTVPGALSDAEVAAVGHVDEQARRTFPLPDFTELEALGDTLHLRHFRALALLRLNRRADVDLDHVRVDERTAVQRLLRLLDAVDGDGDVADELDDELLDDRTVWPVIVGIAGPDAIEPDDALARRFPAFCEWLALHLAREQLFLGDWAAAERAADTCLSLAQAEVVRDEALNLKACGLHHQGDDVGAIEALEEAIAGGYSTAHLANMGVVAAELRPDLAATYLGRLVREAPTTAMKVNAGLRAVGIWATSDAASWQQSDGASSLPDVIRDPLRSLVAGAIGLDDFRAFAALLSMKDSAWFGDPAHVAASPHRASLDARYYQARARRLDEAVQVMAEPIRTGTAPDWLVSERDSLRDAVIEVVLENINEPDNALGAVALTMQQQGVLDGEYDAVLFGAVGIASVTYHLSVAGEEIADHVVSQLHQIRQRFSQLEADQRERVAAPVELATRRVAINRMLARDRELEAAARTINQIVDRARYTQLGTPSWESLIWQVRPILSTAVHTRQDMVAWRALVDHDGARRDIQLTIQQADELERVCRQFD